MTRQGRVKFGSFVQKKFGKTLLNF